MAGTIVATGPNIRQTRKCMYYYIMLCAQLFQVVCASMCKQYTSAFISVLYLKSLGSVAWALTGRRP